jgi:pimeloyl-ACP methyl ester carboxylesterase
METMTGDGLKLKYTDEGSVDPPLVFIHGWTCDHTHWRFQAPEFAKKHRVVTVDLRGHGESDKPDQDYSIDAFVGDVTGLIGELGLQKPVIIGHSMGGTIALNLARKRPNLALGIVMIDSPVVPLPGTMQPLVEQVFAGLNSPEYQAIAEEFVRMNMFNADSPPGLADEVLRAMGAPQRVTVTAIASTIAAESMRAGPIPVPALFIRAATAFASEDELRERYPGLEVRTVGCGHFVQWEKPEETNRLIAGFLERVA